MRHWATAVIESFQRGRAAYRAVHPVRKRPGPWLRIYFFLIGECPTKLAVAARDFSMEDKEVLATAMPKDFYTPIMMGFLSEGQVVHGNVGPKPTGRAVIPPQMAPIAGKML